MNSFHNSDITVTKMGEIFKVERYVDADNYFRIKIRNDFYLYLTSNYTVKNGFIG